MMAKQKDALKRLEAWLDKNTRDVWQMAQMWGTDSGTGYAVALRGDPRYGDTLAAAIHAALDDDALPKRPIPQPDSHTALELSNAITLRLAERGCQSPECIADALADLRREWNL